MPLGRLLVIPLGEAGSAEIEAAVARHFGHVEVVRLDRGELRKRPLETLLKLRSCSFDAAVLVAPDLAQPRLRLTSFLLVLPRARERWMIDLPGGRERWSLASHIAQHGPAILRHLFACGAALTFGAPLLKVLDAVIQPRQLSLRKRPEKILYLRSQLWLGLEGGGSVAHTAGVIGGLGDAGAEVRVISSDLLAGVDAPTRVIPPEVWFDGWPRELEDLVYNVAFFAAALRVARAWKPDAIYQRHTAFNVSGAVLSRLLRIPLVLEFNSSEVWKGRYWGGLRLARVARLVEHINQRAADRIVVVSRVLADELIGREPVSRVTPSPPTTRGVTPGVTSTRKSVTPTSHSVTGASESVTPVSQIAARILVNPNGVDPRVFRPDLDSVGVRRRLGLGAAEVVVGFSGTFGLWHGIPTLARVIPQVIAAQPNVRWLLIGDGPLRPLVDQALAEAQQHGATHAEYAAETADETADGTGGWRVAQVGMVPHRDMPSYLAACDILVSPHGKQADGAEFFGSPTKLYEYMAMGRAIVASEAGQIGEVLCDGQSALLVPPDDVEALREAIVRLVDDADLRQRLGRAAREAAEARHTWRQNAERVLKCLEPRNE